MSGNRWIFLAILIVAVGGGLFYYSSTRGNPGEPGAEEGQPPEASQDAPEANPEDTSVEFDEEAIGDLYDAQLWLEKPAQDFFDRCEKAGGRIEKKKIWGTCRFPGEPEPERVKVVYDDDKTVRIWSAQLIGQERVAQFKEVFRGEYGEPEEENIRLASGCTGTRWGEDDMRFRVDDCGPEGGELSMWYETMQ